MEILRNAIAYIDNLQQLLYGGDNVSPSSKDVEIKNDATESSAVHSLMTTSISNNGHSNHVTTVLDKVGRQQVARLDTL